MAIQMHCLVAAVLNKGVNVRLRTSQRVLKMRGALPREYFQSLAASMRARGAAYRQWVAI
jgi:hypothetical protein